MKNSFLILLICCFTSIGFCEELSVFPSQKITELEVETSFPIEDLAENFADYIKQDIYPQTHPYYIDLRFSDLAIDGNFELNSEDILNSYFDYFFPTTNTYIHSLDQQDTQNIKSIECLLLQQKKVLLFIDVTSDWEMSGLQPIESNIENITGAQGFLVVGFDHHAKYFIAKTCWGSSVGENGYILFSYDYVQKYGHCSFYEEPGSAITEEVRNVTLNVTKWDVGGGNIFTPKAKIYGNITGHPAFIKWLRIVVEYSNKKRVVLKQIIVKPGDSFVFREKYSRFGSKFCSLECTNNDFEVTRFIKRKID